MVTIQIPEMPGRALEALHAAGFGAWVVGGAVRDSLLDRLSADWDLTAACQPEDLLRVLPQAKPMGGVYGTVVWHGVEITPCRTEEGYSDNRHPDAVHFGADIVADLARRDFTVNAMAWDGTQMVDPYHGQEDLQNHLLRCVGQPDRRFTEDALRILRLYRFAGTLGFAIEPGTELAALTLAESLQTVSAPRVRGEVTKALAGPRPSALAPLIAAGGLESFGIPAERLVENPAGLDALDKVPSSALCRWWALLRLTGANPKKVTQIFDFGKSFLRDLLKMDSLYDHGCPVDCHDLKLLLMDNWYVDPDVYLAAFAALDGSFAGASALYRRLLESGEPYLVHHLRITPAELLVEGIPGRKISKVQNCLLKAVIDTPAYNVYPVLAQMAKGSASVV